ncbi:MAG: hypothetical protein ACK4MY_08700 [Brevundimonas sp.]
MTMNLKVLIVGMLACVACARSPNQETPQDIIIAPVDEGWTSEPPASEAAIAAHLQQRVQRLAPAYPQARITSLRFNASRIAACGLLETPGEQRKHLIVSLDRNPSTVADRGLSSPSLTKPGDWRHVSEAASRMEAFRIESCAKLGLLPEGFDAEGGRPD